MRRLLPALLVALTAVSVAAAAPPRSHLVGAKVGTRATQLGTVLVDGRGHTLYVFDQTTCTGACASTWPPFTVTTKPSVHGVAAARLGTRRLPGGKLQVTFGGKPLYFYAGDSGPGQVAGASVPHWAALSPTGTLVRASPAPPQPVNPGGDGY